MYYVNVEQAMYVRGNKLHLQADSAYQLNTEAAVASGKPGTEEQCIYYCYVMKS